MGTGVHTREREREVYQETAIEDNDFRVKTVRSWVWEYMLERERENYQERAKQPTTESPIKDKDSASVCVGVHTGERELPGKGDADKVWAAASCC